MKQTLFEHTDGNQFRLRQNEGNDSEEYNRRYELYKQYGLKVGDHVMIIHGGFKDDGGTVVGVGDKFQLHVKPDTQPTKVVILSPHHVKQV